MRTDDMPPEPEPQPSRAPSSDAGRELEHIPRGRFPWLTALLVVAGLGALASTTMMTPAVLGQRTSTLPSRERALRGRSTPIPTASEHFVFRTPLTGPYPAGTERVYFGMGCFWGAERRFWTIPGVVSTAAGYMGGYTPNATYEEVCSGETGHAEMVQVAYDPRRLRFPELLRAFWEGHDPTQGMRQGNDVGTQYRSAIYTTTPAQLAAARRSVEVYQEALTRDGFGRITTEVRPASEAGAFYFAEDYHQQYLAKNPNGYCGHGGTGTSCPIGLVPYEG
jgi:peptide-methionine (S)-S-oxide reductase